MLTISGLSLICIAWIYQFYSLSVKKNSMISSAFVALYILGVALLVIDGFMTGISSIMWLNLVSGIIALLTLITVLFRK